jgi:hypothetical protein
VRCCVGFANDGGLGLPYALAIVMVLVYEALREWVG